jgi:thiol:disulfide interchange protein DsbC
MKTLALVLASLVSFSAMADEAAVMMEKIKKNFPAIPFTAVAKTPAPGIFEVTIDKDVLYVDSTGNYFFPTMVDMRTRKNFGEERKAELNKIDFDKLPFADAIKLVNGKGTRKMAVFSDPNCSFCQRLERNLQTLPDVTIYVFPVAILGADSLTKTTSVMCSTGDKAKIWKGMMLEGLRPATRTCPNDAVQRNNALFTQNNFQGTPAIIYESGMVSRGYVENNKIEEILAKK